MNILYMGYFCNGANFNRLVEAGSHSSHARQQLETKMLSGMISKKGSDTLEMISYLPETADVRRDIGCSEDYGGIRIQYLWCDKKNPFSVISAMRRNKQYIKKWARNKEERVVLTYSVNPIHVVPLNLLRKKYHIKTVTLCSEVSVFRRKENLSLAARVSSKISSLLDNSFDGYIVLTPYMNELVNKRRMPHLVMEGIANRKTAPAPDELPVNKAILYAGGLTEDNGIKILLEGFVRVKRPDIELWICGEGPLEGEVRKFADAYGNISYYGIVSNEKVQLMERRAMLLISPRFSGNAFTRYSFPSKIIEYMSSGTPTALTRLAGVPEEYFDYVYVLEDETAAGVQQLITKVLEQSPEERKKLGEAAKKFVLQNKSPDIQGGRIIHFLRKIVNGL